MSDLHPTIKPENDFLPSSKTDPPAYMANVDNDGLSAKPSLYQKITKSQKFQMFCRIFQMLSSIIALIIFTIRFAKIANDVNRATTASNDAVLGILIGAVIYDISSMIGKYFLKNGGPNALRVFWVVADIAFVIAFIMVAELTSPGRGMASTLMQDPYRIRTLPVWTNGSFTNVSQTSGPCHTIRGININLQEFGINCELPTGTFVMSIINTILHVVTAIFNPIWSLYKKRKNKSDEGTAAIGQSELQA